MKTPMNTNRDIDLMGNFNPDDYIVLNPIGELSHIGKNEIAVGIRNFLLAGKHCLMEYEYHGKKYKRKHTDVVPRNLAGNICSVQVYEEIISNHKNENLARL